MNIEIQNIHKSFGDKQVLKDISLSAQSGKAVGVLGRNGAGKTTLIRIVMGVFGADSGDVLIDGKPLNRNKIVMGYLPEERGLYSKKIIQDQLVYFGMLKGLSKKEALKSVEYWLERLGMTEHAKRKLSTLSKGNQQKIQLVVTLVANPDVIILDEPFSGLDPVNAKLLKDVVKELIDDNKLVLFSSHQMNYIEEFCQDIVILNGGEVVLSGNIKQIQRSYTRNKIIIASPEIEKIINFIDEKYTVQGEKILVELATPQDKNSFIEKLLLQKFDIDEIKVYEPSLNDIFVEYTEDKI